MPKGVFSKLIVAGCLLFIVLFTIAVLYCFYVHQVEPTIITPLVYSFFGGELVMLFLKKRKDQNNQDKENERNHKDNACVDSVNNNNNNNDNNDNDNNDNSNSNNNNTNLKLTIDDQGNYQYINSDQIYKQEESIDEDRLENKTI